MQKSWEGIHSILSKSFSLVEVSPENSLEWVNFCWNFTVGQEIAAVSEVAKLSSKILFIQVNDQKWIPVLEAMKDRLLNEIKRQTGLETLERIQFNRTSLDHPPHTSLKTG